MSEKDFSEADFDEFAKKFSEYLDAANESKKRGNNDYNPLLVIRYAKDEAKLHTRILHSFLDTNGAHYQDDLFLQLFLETLKLKDCGDDKNLKQWFGNTKNAQVEKEYYIIDKELDEKGFIDLYISNDDKHIILENKVDSGDGDKQIAKYIGGLRDKGIEYENIAVVYLSPFGREPSPNSLCLKDKNIKWQIKGDLLEFNENKVKYKQISYEKDILAWIKECQKEVGNITSLNSALEFYKDIVEIITDKKESKMNIAGFFKEKDEKIQQERFKVAFEILSNRNQIIGAYLKQITYNLKKQFENCNIEYHDDNIPFISVKTQEYSLEKNTIQFFFYISNYGAEYEAIYCSILTEKISNVDKKLEEIQEFIKKNNFSEIKLYKANVKVGSNQDRICFEDPNEFYTDFEEINNFEKEVSNFIKERIDLVNQLNAKLKEFKA